MKITSAYWIPLGLLAVSLIIGVILVNQNSSHMVPATNDVAMAAVTDPPQNQVPVQIAAAQGAKKIVDGPPPELRERFKAMQDRRPHTNFDAATVAAAVARETLWATATSPSKNLPLKPEEFTDGRQFINFDEIKIETLIPGDSLKISIDELKQSYQVIIDRVEQHDYEHISWHGHLDAGDGQSYSVNFTRGENLTVAGLDTPEGSYVLQAHGNNGWIASSGLLFKVDPEVSDVVYPVDEEHTL